MNAAESSHLNDSGTIEKPNLDFVRSQKLEPVWLTRELERRLLGLVQRATVEVPHKDPVALPQRLHTLQEGLPIDGATVCPSAP